MNIDATSREPLNLLASSGGGCCGGGACGCGHGAADGATAGEPTAGVAGVEASFLVSGMTCGHCVASVTEEVGAIEGVVNVNVDLNAQGASRVTVQATHPIETDALRTAIADAGYEIVGR
ncbi:MAG TPA: cation transporter [Microcella sp.]|nr:cation transporter [Microcella sp.]